MEKCKTRSSGRHERPARHKEEITEVLTQGAITAYIMATRAWLTEHERLRARGIIVKDDGLENVDI